MSPRVIQIHGRAPAKPVTGAACNGCGVCCLAEPCPLGAVVSLRRSGGCAALHWDASRSLYRCGLVVGPRAVPGLGRGVVVGGVGRLLSRLAARWIATGTGCDSDAEVLPGPRC